MSVSFSKSCLTYYRRLDWFTMEKLAKENIQNHLIRYQDFLLYSILCGTERQSTSADDEDDSNRVENKCVTLHRRKFYRNHVIAKANRA